MDESVCPTCGSVRDQASAPCPDCASTPSDAVTTPTAPPKIKSVNLRSSRLSVLLGMLGIAVLILLAVFAGSDDEDSFGTTSSAPTNEVASAFGPAPLR